jgi:Protein of unknown function (DUF1360)
MRFYWLVLGALTVWRITHLFQAEDGPWDIVVWLRQKAGAGFFGKLLDCFYCLSVWVAVPFAGLIGETWFERALLWPSLSAAAILLERLTNPAPKVTPVSFTEDPAEENDHVMLRQKEGTNTGSPNQSTD